ncbi:hypothetical protein B0T16DRAFT_324002 [Cercophora newfieldiana]|uniref:Uncharacterized protein n=1 Tax=Cercophora newfieldiana TaxID=92897 RepID=A0AA40CVI8_9PEZI|nr:hypothetical protein B0T16DRAFT_324002 [Cercophora newfieldiana]
MPHEQKSKQIGLSILLLVLLFSVVSASDNKFESCRDRVLGILNGTELYEGIDNITIWKYPFIYTGNIQGLDPRYRRKDILTLTYDGCVAICGADAQLQEPRTALAMVTTWIFPLAIVLSLPYEAFHQRDKVWRTLGATVNWLGSPQTALTATIHNFFQIREAHRQAFQQRRPSDEPEQWNDALYVLTCMNQYEITGITSENLKTLTYGLFRPTVYERLEGGRHEHRDRVLTKELLSQLAFQLRMLRRRAVIPTLASLATFLVAFIFSLVLSFADVGESSSVDPLILGLLYSWLPILVVFAIVDRNPVSSDRSRADCNPLSYRELMGRWLYNVRAVMQWRDRKTRTVNWWPGPAAPDPATTETTLHIGRFIGQGRSMQYAGLSYAVMNAIRTTTRRPVRRYPERYVTIANEVHDELQSRPTSWFITAFISLALVMLEVMLAFTLAFNTPTVGLGCWSGSFAIYAVLSSLSWGMSLAFMKPNRLQTGLCYAFNAVAFGWLVTVTILILTGAMNTCHCLTSPFAYPWFGGYITLVDQTAIRDMFKVTTVWATAAGFGLASPTITFGLTVIWWVRCAHLWKSNEEGSDNTERMARDLAIDTTWLVSS